MEVGERRGETLRTLRKIEISYRMSWHSIASNSSCALAPGGDATARRSRLGKLLSWIRREEKQFPRSLAFTHY